MVNLQKAVRGQAINLQKVDPSLRVVRVALGWKTQKFDNRPPIDIDVSVFMLDVNGQVKDQYDFIYYNNTVHQRPDSAGVLQDTGAVVHSGDNREGDDNGDAETIILTLDKMPKHIIELAFVVTIFNAQFYSFGDVKDAYIHVYNDETNTKLVEFDLSEDYSTAKSLEACNIYTKDNQWRFKGTGNGLTQGLSAFVKHYGLEVGQE